MFFLCLGHSSIFASPADSEAYLDILVEQSRKKDLSQKRLWHLLLHYKKGFFGGVESQEDGPDFFNAAKGKTDPQAELAATLKQFFSSLGSLKKGEEHPQCNFPARYKWLKSQLSFDPQRLQEQSCPRFEGWRKGLIPERITLVFASYYMNNPASMFGHTLLRIDKKREGVDQKLLDYGVNYAATLDTDNALLYSIKGLLGFFKGTFTIFPYYTKVQKYSQFESRDLWEYALNFTEDQIDMFLRHLWELGGNYFDYYYFQENCSYHILSLLEVANPALRLTDSFWFHVIPSDTVKAVTRYEDLIAKKVYRPSLLSQMNHKRLQMNEQEAALFQALIVDRNLVKTEPYMKLNVDRKALVLDTFLDYAQYQSMGAKGDQKTALAGERDILLERSRLKFQRQDRIKQIEFSTLPEQGHGSDRLKLGSGRTDGQIFEEFSYRPAYHDLLAKDTGYGKDSQILFLDLTLRYYNDLHKSKLERLQLIDIISLTPYDQLFKKKSWIFSIGLDTIKDIECGLCNALKTHYGIGLTYKPSPFAPAVFYTLLDFEVEAARQLEDNFRAGGGGTLGFLVDVTDDWRLQVIGNYLTFPLGHVSDYAQLAINQRISVNQNLDLRAEFSRLKDKEEWLLSINYYF
ncbi:MAG: DUF4105 domain-containing protein [Nitrospiria bacterium]